MKSKLLVIVTAALALAASAARGAVFEYYLKIEGVVGESADAVHPESIEIASWSLGCSKPPPVSPNVGGDGGVVFTGLELTGKVSKASPQLMMACATGKVIPKAVLYGRKSGEQQEYLQITLTDVMVTSWSSSSSPGTGDLTAGSPPPVNSISINFTKIEYKYIAYDDQHVAGIVEIPLRQ